MTKIYFGTKRFECRPLEKEDIENLEVIAYEHHVSKSFHFGDNLTDFLHGLDKYECFPVGVFRSKNDVKKLVGFINGYIYNKQDREMLLEFFFTENYYTLEHVKEILHYYIHNCKKLGFKVFRIEVPYSNTDTVLKSFLENTAEVHWCPEDFRNEDGEYFSVFKIF